MRLSLFILVTIFLFQCRPAIRENTDISSSSTALPEDFKSFYNKFHTDTLFQVERITFPLEGVQNANQGKVDVLIPIHWEREDWVLHKPFNDFNGTFTRTFQMTGPIVIEDISDANKYFAMERRFAKLNDEWHLIYYGIKK